MFYALHDFKDHRMASKQSYYKLKEIQFEHKMRSLHACN